MGKYLTLKDEDTGPVELADRFYLWLCSTDFPSGSRAGVVLAIASKLNVSFPGKIEDEKDGKLTNLKLVSPSIHLLTHNKESMIPMRTALKHRYVFERLAVNHLTTQ